jgi:transposase
VCRAGVEGTGSFGAGLARFLGAAGIRVVEVTRPNRRARRHLGKTLLVIASDNAERLRSDAASPRSAASRRLKPQVARPAVTGSMSLPRSG